MEQNFDNILFFARKYSRNYRTGEICDLDKHPIDFSKVKVGDSKKRLIAYNLAIFDICASIKHFVDKDGNPSVNEGYAQNIFYGALPIFESFEKLIVANARDDKLEISNKQIRGVIDQNEVFKYADDVVDRLLKPTNFKAFCDGILDTDIQLKQENLMHMDITPAYDQEVDIKLSK